MLINWLKNGIYCVLFHKSVVTALDSLQVKSNNLLWLSFPFTFTIFLLIVNEVKEDNLVGIVEIYLFIF